MPAGRPGASGRAAARPGPVVLPRCTTVSASNWRSGLTCSPRSRAQSRRAPSAPLSSSGWRTVLRPIKAASEMSSKPITESWPGTATPSRSAAASTPIAWVSEAAKIAVGGSGRPSSSEVNASAWAGPCGPTLISSWSAAAPAAVQRPAVALQPPVRSGEAQRRRRVAPHPVADEADPGVPEREQMLGGQAPAGRVVDHRVRHAADAHVDRHQRHTRPPEGGDLAGRAAEATSRSRRRSGAGPAASSGSDHAEPGSRRCRQRSRSLRRSARSARRPAVPPPMARSGAAPRSRPCAWFLGQGSS